MRMHCFWLGGFVRRRRLTLLSVSWAVMLLAGATAQAQLSSATISFPIDQPGAALSSNLFGIGGRWQVSIPLSSGARFYRLKR